MRPFGKSCFKENRSMFTDPLTNAATDPEKYNLYGGLVGMANDLLKLVALVEKQNSKLDEIKRKVDTL